MNQALSTQIPQIGDSSQQLLARMAAALADQNQQIARVNWLASASRSTDQFLELVVPPGVIGVALRCLVTANPGTATTLQLLIQDVDTYDWIGPGVANASNTNHLILLKTGGMYLFPGGTFVAAPGLSERIRLCVVQSGAGSFTYSASYTWLKK
jgi:hypothetical protein